jgi:hypothetical protein
LYYITHTSLRYRHPIDPVVLLLSAVAAGAFWNLCVRHLFGKAASESTVPVSVSPATTNLD